MSLSTVVRQRSPRFVLFLVLFLLSVSPQILFGKTFKMDPERTIRILGQIGQDAIQKYAVKIEQLSNQNSNPIFFLINSPGGEVFSGSSVLDAMDLAKARGIKFKCVSVVEAQSMGFLLLVRCDERYAFSNTRLMFHPSRGGADPTTLHRLKKDSVFIEWEKDVMKEMQTKMGMEKSDFEAHYFAQTTWTGKSLSSRTARARFISVIDNIQGIVDIFAVREELPPNIGGRQSPLIPSPFPFPFPFAP